MQVRVSPSNVERFFQLSLLGMLASGLFALAGSEALDLISRVVLCAAMAVRAVKAFGWIELDWSGRRIAGWTFASVCFYPLDSWYISGSAPVAGVHLAVALVTLKLLTAKTKRDYLYLKLIASVELMAAALLTVNLGFFVFLALFLLFAVAALASGEVRQSTGPETVSRAGLNAFGRRLTVTSFVLCGGILLMTAGMFFVLPRAARGALGHFMPDGPHLPGFAERVTLGDIGRIQQSSRAVMHIHADTGESLNGLRWRGGALTRFDGQTWDNPRVAYEQRLNVEHGLLTLGWAPKRRPGHEIEYQVQEDEIASDTLFFAGTPESIRINMSPIWRSAAGAFHVQGAPSGLIYRAYSFVEDEHAAAILPPGRLATTDREDLTQVPDLDPRVPALARSMAGDALSDEAKARAIERHLRQDYGYTLELPSKPVRDPLANFLFVRKKGHCEYFASALAIMLRTLGIPTRVVTGFQSGVFNSLTGWQVVRASDAHSWVEAWLDDSGWTVLDATPPATEAESEGLLGRAALLYDAANQFWQDWILRYDLQRQVVLANRLHQLRFDRAPDAGAWWDRNVALARRAVMTVMGLLALVILGVFYGPDLARWWRNRRRVIRARRGEGQASDATLLYERMLAAVARRGFQKPTWITPSEFARVLPASEMSVLVDDLTTAYNELRFGGRPDAAPRMIRMLDRLEGLER